MISIEEKEELKELHRRHRKQLRELQKEFSFPHHETRLVFQFAQFDPRLTKAVLKELSRERSYKLRLKEWLNQPEKAQSFISKLRVELPTEQGEQEFPPVKKAAEDCLRNVPLQIFKLVGLYLFPSQFFKLQLTSKRFSKPSLFDSVYRFYLHALLSATRRYTPVYDSLRQYIIDPFTNFPGGFKQQAMLDIRKLLWGKNFSEELNYELPSRELFSEKFRELARVNFRGFYVFKQKYVRISEKNVENDTTQVIVVNYYRYLRFLPDATCVLRVCNKKLPPLEIVRLFDSPSALLGEYVLNKDRVFAKFVSGRQLFSYDFRAMPGGSSLILISHRLNIVEENMIQQVLYKQDKNVSSREYKWVGCPVGEESQAGLCSN